MKRSNVVGWFLLCMPIIVFCITFVIVDYNLNACHVKGCSKDKIYGSDFCYKHTCKQKNCYNVKNENEKYCPDHIEYYRQERAKKEAEDAKKPNCQYSGCMNKAEIGHSYCALHECAVSGCQKCETAGSIYCVNHTCIEPGCSNKATESSGRCSSCEKTYKTKNTTKTKTKYKSKSKSEEVEWPDCDDYEDFDHFMDDWEGEMPDGSNAEDYWDDW